MDITCLPSTAHYSHTLPPPLSAGKLNSNTSITLISKPSRDPNHHNKRHTSNIRRPTTHNNNNNKPITLKTQENPLKKLFNSQTNPIKVTTDNKPSHDTLSNKLWLSSKLSPPPVIITPFQEKVQENEKYYEFDDHLEGNEKGLEFREKGKIFVGNLPVWVKKSEVFEFFRQFGPIKNVVVIKGHDELERNMGFGFVMYDGKYAEKAAMKAVEFDGVEFHGRELSVQLDNGRRMKGKREERVKWMESGGKEDDKGVYGKSKWHEDRDGLRREFKSVLESQPENWQAVVSAFENIKKVIFLFLHMGKLNECCWLTVYGIVVNL